MIADFLSEHAAGRTPNPVRPVQRRDQVRRVPAAGRRARRRPRRDRPLRARGPGAAMAHGTSRVAPTARRTRATCSTCWDSASSPARSSRSAGSPSARRERSRSGSGCPSRPSPTRRSSASPRAGDAGGFVRSAAPQLVRAGGEVVDPDGTVIAEHDGTFAFTVGQRRGLGVAIGAPCTCRGRRRDEPSRGGAAGAAHEAGAGGRPGVLGRGRPTG